MTNTAIKPAEAEALRKNEAKWTKPLMAAGWNAIPSIIIEKQEALGLDCRARRQEEHDAVLGSRDAIDHLAEKIPHGP